MKYLLGLLLLSLAASAQYQYQYPRDPRGDGRYYDRGDHYRGGDVVGRLRSDLDRAEASSYANGGDRRRFDRVREELREFQRSGSRRDLNDTISALQKVVDHNRLSYRDRDMLANDLYQMRDFRGRNGWR